MTGAGTELRLNLYPAGLTLTVVATQVVPVT